MINFEKLYEAFGDTLPVHISEFFSNPNNDTLLADLKIYNTANKVLAYNILKARYSKFLSTHKTAEKSVAEKLAEIRNRRL